MKLVELNPKFQHKLGIQHDPDPSFEDACGVSFDCPVGVKHRHFIPFEGRGVGPGWTVSGSGMNDLSLSPSILFDPRPGAQALGDDGCAGWHGFITNGDVTAC